jgi:IclR family pca regulon transcriptional regulator
MNNQSSADTPPSPSLARQDWIAGLDKGLGLLEAFSGDAARLSASQAAQLCGLSRTAARRYLLTLAHLGYLATDNKLFWLTPKVLRLGHSYLESARLPRVVQPYLQRITAGTNEIAYLAVLDNDDVVYLARNGPHRGMNTGYVLGARVQAQVTAAGLLMLAMKGEGFTNTWLAQRELKTYTSFTVTQSAQLNRVMQGMRQQGWALSEQQLELGYRGIAVPLRDRKGEMIAALSVTMPIGQETSTDALARVLPVLRDTAQALRNLV